MLKREAEKKTHIFEDVIPAFLAPDHILEHGFHTEHKENPVIDVDDKEISAQNEGLPSDFIVQERLYNALDNNHIDVFMQPIVTLPQRHAKFFEIFGRLRVKAGQYLDASDYITHADDNFALNKHDTLLLTQALKNLPRHQNLHGSEALRYFFNVRPRLLRDSMFMNQVINILSQYRELAHTLVFEMHYSDFLTLSPTEHKVLDALAQIGCCYSLDHVSDIPKDIKTLRKKNVHFVKITADTLLEQGRSETGFSDLLSRKHSLEINDIHLIVEKVEKEKQVLDILDYNIKYGQGFLFGRPDFQSVYTRYRAFG